jgi:hypothetical protein
MKTEPNTSLSPHQNKTKAQDNPNQKSKQIQSHKCGVEFYDATPTQREKQRKRVQINIKAT